MVWREQRAKASLEETDQVWATGQVAEAEAQERSGQTERHQILVRAEMGHRITSPGPRSLAEEEAEEGPIPERPRPEAREEAARARMLMVRRRPQAQ